MWPHLVTDTSHGDMCQIHSVPLRKIWTYTWSQCCVLKRPDIWKYGRFFFFDFFFFGWFEQWSNYWTEITITDKMEYSHKRRSLRLMQGLRSMKTNRIKPQNWGRVCEKLKRFSTNGTTKISKCCLLLVTGSWREWSLSRKCVAAMCVELTRSVSYH